MSGRANSGDEYALALALHSDECRLSLEQLSHATGLATQEIRALVEFGVFEPGGDVPEAWIFSGHTVVLARTAQRLLSHFEINTAGLALALSYLQQIETLQQQIRLLECQRLK